MSVIEKALKLVGGDRRANYGAASEDWTRTAKMWSAILGCRVMAWQAALCMIAVKISRECYKHKEDNLVDIAGYAEVCAMIWNKK